MLNPIEDCPADPYTAARVERLTVKMAKTPSDFDKLRQFLEMDRKVLRFYCMLDDRDRLFGQFKKFIIHVRTFTLCHLTYSAICQRPQASYSLCNPILNSADGLVRMNGRCYVYTASPVVLHRGDWMTITHCSISAVCKSLITTTSRIRLNCNSTAVRPFDDYITTELLHCDLNR